jgi:crotonobetainyl-CoA:carnitine CoA-transferase CaiB-like acyl-CoA transferase
MSINRGRRSIAVNLRDEKNRRIVYELAKKSHILLENFRPTVAEKLGVDYEAIVNVNP